VESPPSVKPATRPDPAEARGPAVDDTRLPLPPFDLPEPSNEGMGFPE
jgi:hypothetical protein